MYYILLINITHRGTCKARIASDEFKYHSGAEIIKFYPAIALTLCASHLCVHLENGISYSGIQRYGLRSELSPPSIVEFKNVLNYIFVSYIIINYTYKFT